MHDKIKTLGNWYADIRSGLTRGHLSPGDRFRYLGLSCVDTAANVTFTVQPDGLDSRYYAGDEGNPNHDQPVEVVS